MPARIPLKVTMTNTVLDSRVAIKWVLPEPNSDVTADVRLLTTLKPTFAFIIDLASLP
jgi:predicted nucleic acid-binding protein